MVALVGILNACHYEIQYHHLRIVSFLMRQMRVVHLFFKKDHLKQFFTSCILIINIIEFNIGYFI